MSGWPAKGDSVVHAHFDRRTATLGVASGHVHAMYRDFQALLSHHYLDDVPNLLRPRVPSHRLPPASSWPLVYARVTEFLVRSGETRRPPSPVLESAPVRAFPGLSQRVEDTF